jgi:hypothetical protein
MTRRGALRLTRPTRTTLTNSTVAASPLSTKTGLEHSWAGGLDGLYRFNRQDGSFKRYTESQGLPSSTIRCIQEDGLGRLWLSTQKGMSRFDPHKETFRNYDVSDGLQSNEFSDGCYQGRNGEMFFGGSNGFNAFFPENVRDDPFVPPVMVTSFKIFNKAVPIGAQSVLTKAIPYVDSLTLSYRDNIFSFEFAALSYANSQKNRYRYKLEGLEPGWNEVGSKQRLATYTNLDPDKYVFRVQGSNGDGVWNDEEGVSLPIVITPHGGKPTGFAPPARPCFWRYSGRHTSGVSDNCIMTLT